MRIAIVCLALACSPVVSLLTPAVGAGDSTVAPDTPEARDLAPARAAIKAKNYPAALAQLKGLVVKYPTADAYTLYGHALWKTGDQAQGMAYYNKALAINPSHRGALEYQGELYVAQGRLDLARANLAKLLAICPYGCEEPGDLKEAIDHAPKGK